jgi:hypothetical protein
VSVGGWVVEFLSLIGADELEIYSMFPNKRGRRDSDERLFLKCIQLSLKLCFVFRKRWKKFCRLEFWEEITSKDMREELSFCLWSDFLSSFLRFWFPPQICTYRSAFAICEKGGGACHPCRGPVSSCPKRAILFVAAPLCYHYIMLEKGYARL